MKWDRLDDDVTLKQPKTFIALDKFGTSFSFLKLDVFFLCQKAELSDTSRIPNRQSGIYLLNRRLLWSDLPLI